MWWIIEFLFVATFVAGWFPCCCGASCPQSCSECDGGCGPDTMRVVIADLSGGDGTGLCFCSGANGTYDCSWLALSNCQWRNTGLPGCGGASTLEVGATGAISADLLEVILTFRTNIGFVTFRWRNDYSPSKVPCMTLSSEAVLFFSKTGAAACDTPASTHTVLVTAI